MTSISIPAAALDDSANTQAAESANAGLRQLVEQSGLSSAVAMTIFNRGLGASACLASQWHGFLAEPGSLKFVPLPSDLLAHAVMQFTNLSALPPSHPSLGCRSSEL